ncbi:uncharacterized protein LOC135833192 [Planococcus citri]|uniref:uncharacterized protein LOC135833192 n=1 Tax=Planococcus citri TaxID=170843 RepID=UPI0031F9B773
MNFEAIKGHSRRIFRNQRTGTLLLALNTRKEKFQKASVRVAKSRSKLHQTKTKLQKAIAEYKKLEKKVLQKKAHYEQTVQQVETVIEESRNPCYHKSDDDEVILWNCSTFVVPSAKKQIEVIDTELSETKLIDSNGENSENKFLNKIPVPCSVMICNIDSSGSIQRNGVAKLDISKKCCICVEKTINSIFYKCKHESCCFECATNATRCPICNCPAIRVIKTYAM